MTFSNNFGVAHLALSLNNTALTYKFQIYLLFNSKGDSGGGFIKQDETSTAWYLIGIISYGSRRCRSEYPGVHVKVESYIDWIKNKIND